MLPARCARLLTPHLLLALVQLSPAHDHRTTGPRFLISDRDPQCNLHCSRTQPKPVCASDGRSYESMCEYQRAKCRDPTLAVAHRGRCKDAGQSKCRLERAQALEQAKKPQEAVFVPECTEDGSFTQAVFPLIQCDLLAGGWVKKMQPQREAEWSRNWEPRSDVSSTQAPSEPSTLLFSELAA